MTRGESAIFQLAILLDNTASIRVLEKCGFTICGRSRDLAQSRGEEIEVVNLDLR